MNPAVLPKAVHWWNSVSFSPDRAAEGLQAVPDVLEAGDGPTPRGVDAAAVVTHLEAQLPLPDVDRDPSTASSGEPGGFAASGHRDSSPSPVGVANR
jgi:hypothetical protein